MAHPHWRADLYCKQLEPKGEVTKVETVWRGRPRLRTSKAYLLRPANMSRQSNPVSFPEIIGALAPTSAESPPLSMPDFDPHPPRFPPPVPPELQIDSPEAFRMQNVRVANLAAGG